MTNGQLNLDCPHSICADTHGGFVEIMVSTTISQLYTPSLESTYEFPLPDKFHFHLIVEEMELSAAHDDIAAQVIALSFSPIIFKKINVVKVHSFLKQCCARSPVDSNQGTLADFQS